MRKMMLAAALLLLFCGGAQAIETEYAEVYQAPIQIKITFTGDCTLGNTPLQRMQARNFEKTIAQEGLEYPFAQVRALFEQDDLTVANLEGVFYDYEANRVEKKYNFRGPTAFAAILPLGGVDAVSLGNNHTLDYGVQGLRATVNALEEAGVAWFAATEDASQTFIFEKDGVKIGFVSANIAYWRELGRKAVQAQFAALKEAGCQAIVGCIHGGVEYMTYHDLNKQERMADSFLSYGADVVICNHPHVVQGMRVQEGKTTLWSLGNFVFGGNPKIRALECLLAQITFSFDAEGTYLGHQVNLLPAHISGEKDYNNFQPCLVQGAEAEAVLRLMERDLQGVTLRPYREGVGAVQDFVPAAREQE